MEIIGSNSPGGSKRGGKSCAPACMCVCRRTVLAVVRVCDELTLILLTVSLPSLL